MSNEPNELAVRGDTGLAKTVEELMMEANLEDRGMGYDRLPLVARINTDDISVLQQGSDLPLKKYTDFDVTILGSIKRRAYYETKEQRVPSCSSRDGVTGQLSAEASPRLPIRNGQRCATCPFDQFGSAIKDDGTPGAGKACNERRVLPVVHPDFEEDIILLSVPTMSIKNWNKFADGLDKKRLSAFAFVTRIRAVPTPQKGSNSNRYGVATFETVRKLDEGDIRTFHSLRQVAKEMLGRYNEVQETHEINPQDAAGMDTPPPLNEEEIPF